MNNMLVYRPFTKRKHAKIFLLAVALVLIMLPSLFFNGFFVGKTTISKRSGNLLAADEKPILSVPSLSPITNPGLDPNQDEETLVLSPQELEMTRNSTIVKVIETPRLTVTEKLNIISKNHTREIIITTATKGFTSLLFNWMCSLRNLNLIDQVLIFTMDESFVKELVEDYGIPSHQVITYTESMEFSTSSFDEHRDQVQSSDTVQYRTLDYQILMVRRTQFIHKVLNCDYTILLADNDAVWWKNPLSFIHRQYAKKRYDFLAQNDGPIPGRDGVCGGFIYMRPTMRMKKLWDMVTRNHTHAVMDLGQYKLTEQELLNLLLPDSGAIGLLLPRMLYPSGYYMFKYLIRKPKLKPLVHVVHNNWIVGSLNKIVRFKYNKMWYLGRNDPNRTNKDEKYRFTCDFSGREWAPPKVAPDIVPVIFGNLPTVGGQQVHNGTNLPEPSVSQDTALQLNNSTKHESAEQRIIEDLNLQ